MKVCLDCAGSKPVVIYDTMDERIPSMCFFCDDGIPATFCVRPHPMTEYRDGG